MAGWFSRLLVATAATQFIVVAIRPFLSYQALALNASLTELAFVTASFSALSLLCAVPVGRAVDRYGARLFVAIGAIGLVVVPVLLLAASNLVTLSVLSAALGIAHLCASAGIQTIIAKGELADRRERRFAHYTLVNSLAQLVAPAMAGLIVGDIVANIEGGGFAEGDRVYVMSTIVAIGGLSAAISLLLSPGSLALRASTPRPLMRRPMSEVLRAPSMLVALLASFTTLSSTDLLAVYLPVYAQSVGISVLNVGLLLATFGLASMIVRLAMTRLLKWIPRQRLLAISMLVPAGALSALPYTTSTPLLYVIMAVAGLGLGLSQPLTMGWVAGQVSREVRGTAMSVRLAGNRLGQTVVPLGVGGIAGATGVAAAFVAPAALLAVGGALVYRVRPNRDR